MSELPAGWRVASLSEAIELQRGFDLPAHARRPGPFPVLTSGEGGGFHDEGPIAGPGFIVGRATNLGRPKWSSGDFWPHNTTMFAKDFKGNDPRWLFHLFEATDLSGFDSGSVQPMLNRNYIAQVRVIVPPLPEQQAIADVLGALDDKIAANTALAATATQLASAEFTMAARQATEAATFADVADVSGGGTPSTKNEEFWGGGIWWATPTDMTALTGPYLEATSRTITEAGLAACNSRLFSPGAILMTSRATIGALAVNSVPTALNQGFIVVEPHDSRLRWWLFHEMESRVDEFISWANGATFLELSRSNFKRLRVRLPSAEIRDRFASRAGVLHDVARVALTENRTLAATRDALLPKLMSGRLRVAKAEKILSEAIAEQPQPHSS